MTKIEEVVRLVKEDGDIIAEAVKEGSYWELQVTFDSKEAVLEYLDFLNQEYKLVTQSEFPTTLETSADFDKAPVGSLWISDRSGGQYERREDSWYWRNTCRGEWVKIVGYPIEYYLPLRYLKQRYDSEDYR